MALRRRDAPVLLLGAALAGAAALLIALTWELTFFQDTWAFLMERQGSSLHDFLAPHNEHLVVFQVALEKLLINTFGMTTAHPELFVMIAMLLANGALLFAYVRRRLGDWSALMMAALLLFLGSAWQVQLWPFEIEFVAPIMTGLGVLLLLEREDRLGDAWACLLIVIGIGFGSLGLSFALAAAADVWVRRRERGLWSRLWIVVVPFALYGLWYVGWGHEAEHHLTLHNLLRLPPYVLEGVGTALAALSGLLTLNFSGPSDPFWGRPLIIVVVALIAYVKWRRPGFAWTLWPVLVAAFSYWILAGLNYIPGREASSPRYVYASAAFVLMVSAELLRGSRLSRRGILIAGALTAVAVMPNLAQMKEGADWLKEQTVLTRADTGAIEIASRTVEPSFRLTPELAGTPSLVNVDAGDYLSAVEAHGSPAYSPVQLAATREVGRHWADVVLARALPVSLETEFGTYAHAAARSCTAIAPGSAPPAGVELAPGSTKIEVAPGPPVSFSLRRFAVAEFPVKTSGAPGESTSYIGIPHDRASQPWFLHLEAQQPVRVCR